MSKSVCITVPTACCWSPDPRRARGGCRSGRSWPMFRPPPAKASVQAAPVITAAPIIDTGCGRIGVTSRIFSLSPRCSQSSIKAPTLSTAGPRMGMPSSTPNALPCISQPVLVTVHCAAAGFAQRRAIIICLPNASGEKPGMALPFFSSSVNPGF